MIARALARRSANRNAARSGEARIAFRRSAAAATAPLSPLPSTRTYTHTRAARNSHNNQQRALHCNNKTNTPSPLNINNRAASAVSIKDSALPDGFELVDGATTASFAKVDAGSKATHSYVARATAAAGVVALEPATVDYKADADGEQVKAASTPAYVEVITPTQQLQRHALTGGRYASLGMLRTTRDWLVAGASFAVLAALFGGNSAYKAASSARASSRRRAALAALEKDQ